MNQDLLVLTSPPASGKTYLVQALIAQLDVRILVICPLRALADECRAKWGNACEVMTHEEWLGKKVKASVVIFDEFHLHYYWGDSFRPLMWEAFYEASLEAELVILLTATLGPEMHREVQLFGEHFNQIQWLDFGNQVLRNKPCKYLRAPSARWLGDLILTCGPTKEVTLIFCAYREEVLQWESKIKARGHRVWKCLGGESAEFSKRVQCEEPPEFIVSTTVLSHGVNLPRVGRIIFLYPVENLDFWIQMVARGGRRGEAFEVFALEDPHGMKWSKWLNRLAICVHGLKIKSDSLKEQIVEWFLKE